MDVIKILKKIIIWEIIILSGSLFFSLCLPIFFVPLYVVTSFALFLKTRCYNVKYNFVLAFLLFVWLFINHTLINDDLTSNMPYIAMLYIVGSFFSISSLSYEFLRKYLLKYYSIICFFSIAVYILNTFFWYPRPSYMDLGSNSYLSAFVFFNVGWEGRLSSIYWEPGQFQMVTMFILCLYSDYFVQYKKYWRQLALPVFALGCTISTGGYLSFAILFVGVLLSLDVFKRKKYLFPFAIFLVAVFCFAIYQSEAIQSKVRQKESNSQSSSFYIRLNDNLGLLNMIKKRPIFGYGMETKSFNNQARKNNNLTSSNGWLCTSAANGIIVSVYFFVFLYKGVRRNVFGIPWGYPFCALVFSQSIEYYLFFPIMFMYVFRFNGQTNHSVLKKHTH